MPHSAGRSRSEEEGLDITRCHDSETQWDGLGSGTCFKRRVWTKSFPSQFFPPSYCTCSYLCLAYNFSVIQRDTSFLEEWSFAEVVFRLNSSERRGRRRRLSEELARLPRRRWSPCLAGCGSESPCVFLLVAVPVFGRDHLCVSSV